MASNQYVNKVVVNNETVIDLTEDTIVPTVLRKGFTAHNRSGESIVGTESFVDISDGTDAGPIFNLTAEGHAEQFSTTGKNLLRGGTFGFTSSTTITLPGTLSAGTYSISAEITSSDIDSTKCLVLVQYTDNTYSPSSLWTILDRDDRASGVIVAEKDFNRIIFYASTDSTKSAGDTATWSNIQLELGTEATDYEPYTGGAPSPSPDYPQEIQVVRTGKNLLPNGPDESFTTSRGVTITRKDGVLIFNGTGTDNGGRTYSFYKHQQTELPAGTYTVSAVASESINVMVERLSDNEVLANTIQTMTFTLDEPTAIYVGYNIVNGMVYDNFTVAIQIEAGSIATPYVPYGYVGMEVQGKNLLPNSEHVDLTQSPFSHSTATISSTVGTYDGENMIVTQSTTKQIRIDCNGLIAGATYTFSFDASRGTYGQCSIYFAYGTDTISSIGVVPSNQWGRISVTFVPSSEQYLYITSSNAAGIYYRKFQLELGTEATEYEPYYHSTTPIPLPSRGWVGSLPDGTADILTLDGAGKVTWEEKTEEVVLDGSTYTLGSRSVSDNSARFTTDQMINVDTGNRVNIVSDKFIARNVISDRSTVGYICAYTNAKLYLTLDATTFQSNSDANTWLSTYPVTVLYPLATPVTEELGYIDLPDIPDGATISIPELDALNVEYIVDHTVSKYAKQWYNRIDSEVDGPISTLQSDVAEIATDAATTRANLSTIATEMAYDAQVINNTYPGRSIQTILGTSDFDSTITALHNRVTAANFEGLRIGDYMNVAVTGYGTIRYLIAAFDHYYNCGNTAMPHHIVFVPNAPITMPSESSYTVNDSFIMWNTTDDNNGTESETNPYLASNLHAWEIGEFLPALPSALQNYLVDFRDLVEVRYNESKKLTDSITWKWTDLGKIWSPSEMEVYGTCVWGTKGWSQGLGSQFPIFRNTCDRIRNGRIAWWLRVTHSGASVSVCDVSTVGYANYNSTTYTGARPFSCFLFG